MMYCINSLSAINFIPAKATKSCPQYVVDLIENNFQFYHSMVIPFDEMIVDYLDQGSGNSLLVDSV